MHGGNHQHDRTKIGMRVAIVGAIVNVILAVVKTVIGYFAQSQALIADGLHSFSDLASDLIVWFAAKKSGEAADKGHPYGHGRFETAATLILGALLILVAIGIFWDSIERLFFETAHQPDSIALYAAAFSILANEALYWYTIFAANKINSDMLRANAWHHRSDAISSIIVFIGIGGALLDIVWLDGVAALVVAVMVAHIGWNLGKNALNELVDSALEDDIVAKIRQEILKIDGVQSIHLLRTRRSANTASADVHVLVSPYISVSEGHMIGAEVEWRLKQNIDLLNDVTVHIDPEDDEKAPPCKNLPLRQEAIKLLKKAWQDIDCIDDIQRIDLHYIAGKITIDLIFLQSCAHNQMESSQKIQQQLQDKIQDYPFFGQIRLLYLHKI